MSSSLLVALVFLLGAGVGALLMSWSLMPELRFWRTWGSMAREALRESADFLASTEELDGSSPSPRSLWDESLFGPVPGSPPFRFPASAVKDDVPSTRSGERTLH